MMAIDCDTGVAIGVTGVHYVALTREPGVDVVMAEESSSSFVEDIKRRISGNTSSRLRPCQHTESRVSCFILFNELR